MTNERKAELFDKAMSWIYAQLVYSDRTEYEETLEEIGFDDEEIGLEMSNIVFPYDEDDEDDED